MAFLKRDITREQSRDTGMAMVLLLLLAFVFRKRLEFVYAAMALHVLNMVAPQLYRPVAMVWLGFSHLLGTVVSRIVLSIVFFLVVVPMGLLRKVTGKDPMKLRVFKASGESVMVERNHTFTARDLERPY